MFYKQNTERNEYLRYASQKLAAQQDMNALRKYANSKCAWLMKSLVPDNLVFGNFTRLTTMLAMHTQLPIKKYNMQCVSIDLSRREFGTVSIALVYIHDGAPVYIAASPAFISSDGEYRHRLIPAENLDALIKTSPEHWKFWLKHIKHELDAGEIAIAPVAWKPLALKIYYLCWIADYELFRVDNVQNNLPDFYYQIAFASSDVLWDKMKRLVQYYKFDKPEFAPVHICTRNILLDPTSIARAGQKLLLLTRLAAQQIGNIKNPVWRELYISRLVSDLVVNNITPHAPIFYDWFIIDLQDTLFSNQVNRVRIEYSQRIAGEIEKAKLLRDKIVSDPTGFISLKIQGLQRRLNIGLEYADSVLLLSDKVLCAVFEQAHRTLADIPKLMSFYYVRANIGPILQERNCMLGYVFSLIYTLSVFYTKYKIIHADLHYNNIAAHFPFTIGSEPHDEPYIIIYKIDNEYYYVPYTGCMMWIIDFSRAIIYENNNEVLADIPKLCTHAISTTFPETYEELNTEIHNIFKKSSVRAYEIMPAVDVYQLCQALISLITSQFLEQGNITPYVDHALVHEHIIPTLDRISTSALLYLRRGIIQLNKNIQTVLPNLHSIILHEYFKEFHVNEFTHNSARIVGIYSNNKLQYSSENMQKFPEQVNFAALKTQGFDVASSQFAQNIQKNKTWNNAELLEQLYANLSKPDHKDKH